MSADSSSRLFDVIRAAAVCGQPCPTNDALCADATGYRSVGAVVAAIQLLERNGAFKVERFNNARVVTFPDGKSTARPANPTPHWRDRQRAQGGASA